jgi:hypothetical protein
MIYSNLRQNYGNFLDGKHFMQIVGIFFAKKRFFMACVWKWQDFHVFLP